MKNSIKIILFLIVSLCFFAPKPVFAAQVFFEADHQIFAPEQDFVLNVFLNTENESVNAIEGTIAFPNDLLEAKEIRDGNSIINFWVDRPSIKEPGIVNFSGIIPGGYHQAKGFLFSIVFKAKVQGKGTLQAQNVKVLLNDGKGTSASVKLSPFTFSISKTSPSSSQSVGSIEDTNPPEGFKPEISKNQDILDGKWFLVFATQDKGSGIDYYQVKEGIFGKFIDAQSPYILQNQKANKEIFVKAVDKNGNEQIEHIYPPNWRAWYKDYRILAIMVLGILFIIFVLGKMLWPRFSK